MLATPSAVQAPTRLAESPAMGDEKPQPNSTPSEALEGQILPLRKRPFDLAFIAFFLLNLGFITYIVDVEQLIIDDPAKFTYPRWPPARLVDLVHWWGHNFDPVLIARPTWWKATIWIDALLFGPFYAVALYAFVKGREWIRLPSVIWASVMLTNVVIILSEETWGPHATPKLGIVLFANASWLLVPLALIARMWRERPFSALSRHRPESPIALRQHAVTDLRQ